MCELNENNYLDGEVVWVKIGSCWWPGEVVGAEKLPPDLLPSFKKPPIAVVKFFQEDTYQYVKNLDSIFKYNCSRKNEFINKGLYMYRTKHGPMDKFPEDVVRAEIAVGGDEDILTRDEFQEVKKESYAGLFGDPRRTPASIKKGKNNKGRLSSDSAVHRLREKSNYKVHILVQGSKSPRQSTESAPSPSTSRAGSEPLDGTPQKEEKPQTEEHHEPVSTQNVSTPGIYACHACNFNTTRLNVLIMHNKSHSSTFTPYMPTLTPLPLKKKLTAKTPKASPEAPSTPKIRKTKQEKVEKPAKKQAKKRIAEESSEVEIKKTKTDAEIKSSLLADWDDGDEESNDESSTVMGGSPEIPIASESPAVPTSAELPSAQVPDEPITKSDKNEEQATIAEKPETSNDAKYEFCEDEDWPVETDIGRKIPRVKNPKRKDENKSLSIDEDEMAREVAELLSKTTLPELPAAPETFKEEENFPDPSVVKSPDKQFEKVQSTVTEKKSSNDTQPTKTIFKTKTFFRSRHSRSQDAIGKYVAEQLNAAERLDMSENEINGAESVSLLEPRISPPVEHVKIARLAPKIQLKKMKAEAAQLLEREKYNTQRNKEQTNLDIPNVIEGIEKSAEVKKIQNEENTFLHDVITDNQNIDLGIKENNKVYGSEHETVNNKMENSNKAAVVDAQNEAIPESTIVSSNFTTKITEIIEPFMNESTASAVDALLSVSRETDRVTKIISDDPPEDLFEDDHKDNRMFSIANGINNEDHKRNGINETSERPSGNNDTNVINHDHLNNGIEKENNHNVISSVLENESKKESSILPLADTLPNAISEVENHKQNTNNLITDSMPSESDLQVAEALINLPSTNSIHSKLPIESSVSGKIKTPEKKFTILNSTLEDANQSFDEDQNIITNEISSSVVSENIISSNDESLTSRFETEEEKCENLFAAQSLVQMSESIDHNINIKEMNIIKDKEIIKPILTSIGEKEIVASSSALIDQNVTSTSNNMITVQNAQTKSLLSESNSPKLLKILEEPAMPKIAPSRKTVTKHVIVPGNEKILNFDIGKASLKSKSPKQKIIIRRATPTKTVLNNVTEKPTSHKIILSPNNKSMSEGPAVQTYAIKSTPDVLNSAESSTIVYQPKIRKITKPVTKLQKIRPQISAQSSPQTSGQIVAQTSQIAASETRPDNNGLYDISSMPVVLSEDILTAESIENMPIVMSDGNIITPPSNPPPRLVRKQSANESVPATASTSKTEVKTLLMNPVGEARATTTPNILSKSAKIRGAKPMLVIDKTTGKQKFIMTKTDTPVKEIKTTTILQQAPQATNKTEKFIILPTTSNQRPVRTQKIVIDPQTRKAHVLVDKGPQNALNVIDNKPVSAKLISSASDSSSTGNTVMIITNAQGAQSRIVLTSEHEKILFPNKQQPNVTQLKQIVHRITPNNGAAPKPTLASPMKTTQRIVKQKNTIITSKGQLIVGGRVATTTQNIAPAPKRIITPEPKKLVQAIQKNASEPLIFLQQKNGTVMQLTVAQFEHLQRTGQIVQKAAPQEKIVVQKAITISPGETSTSSLPKQRVRKHVTETITSAKKVKHELAITPARAMTQMPTLAPLTNTILTPAVPPISSTSTVIPGSNYSELENFEELLPSTAIARQPETMVAQPELPQPSLPQTAVADGQLLAIPGENFGGPSGTFYLCVEDNGTLTPIDNRPLVLENNQLVPMAESIPILTPQPERRDILEAALANSDVFHAEPSRDEAPDFRDLNANVSVHCRVSETSTTLNQPIMTPVEVPSNADSEPAVPSNLEDGLAVIGVTPPTVPTSLELPITVTDPRIAPKTTDPLSNNNYGTLMPSPNTEMTYVTTDETQVSVVGPISMPLLTDEESVGKSMPILTDEVADRTVSSVESALGSPSSVDVRESETEDGQQWPRRLLTPCSDTSEASTEIPLQPVMQLSANDIQHNS